MEMLSRASGSRKDITSLHIRQTRELLGKQCGRKINLPYGLEAVRDYSGISVSKAHGDEDCQWTDRPFISVDKALLSDLADGETVEFEWGDQGKIAFSVIHECDLKNIIQKKYTKWFDYDKIKDNIVIRTRKTGDYLTINQSNQRKTLKKYFTDQKVPQNEREHACLLTQDSHVMWVVGGRISSYYKVGEGTKNILQAEYTQYSI